MRNNRFEALLRIMYVPVGTVHTSVHTYVPTWVCIRRSRPVRPGKGTPTYPDAGIRDAGMDLWETPTEPRFDVGTIRRRTFEFSVTWLQ
jgi:hypothetical protein